MDQDGEAAVINNNNNNLAERVCFNTHNLICRKRAGLAVHRGIDAQQFSSFILRCSNCQASIPENQPSFACDRAAECNKDFCLSCCASQNEAT